ncbi:MAG: hypothetical protein ACK5MN_11800 [Lachnospiraceae bacterium]
MLQEISLDKILPNPNNPRQDLWGSRRVGREYKRERYTAKPYSGK